MISHLLLHLFHLFSVGVSDDARCESGMFRAEKDRGEYELLQRGHEFVQPGITLEVPDFHRLIHSILIYIYTISIYQE